MRKIFLYIAFLLLASCVENEKKYSITVHYAVNDSIIIDTAAIKSIENHNIKEYAFKFFMQQIAEYDYQYYKKLHEPLREKLKIKYPFEYNIINHMGNEIKQDSLLDASHIHKRNKYDYWGRMWYKAQGLEEPKKKKKQNVNNKVQEKKKEKKSKNKTIEPKSLPPFPKI